LFTGLRDATTNDLTNAHRIDAGALQNSGLDAPEKGDGVRVGERTVALSDSRSAGFDDDGLAHGFLLTWSIEWFRGRVITWRVGDAPAAS
jgi:hypothetical protein